MKKRIKVFLAVFTILSMLCGITAFAVEARYSYTKSTSSSLTISNNTASCYSTARGMMEATAIDGIQYLEKKNGSKWDLVTDYPWTDSTNKNVLTMSNSKGNLSSGTYRVRATFVVYSGLDSEDVEAISKEVTI